MTRPRKWRDVDMGNYHKLCSTIVDLSSYLPVTRVKKKGGWGKFYRVESDVVLLFGLTGLKAQVAWKEKNIEKRSEPKILHEPEARRSWCCRMTIRAT